MLSNIPTKYLSGCLVLLLAACAGNKGGFTLDEVHAPPPSTQSSQPSKPSYTDEQTAPRPSEAQLSELMQPGLGFSAKIPRRSTGAIRSELEETVTIKPESIQRLNGNLNEPPHQDEIRKNAKFSGTIIHSHDGLKPVRQRDLQYVRSGWVMDPLVGLQISNGPPKRVEYGQVGYVYYQGTQPSSSLPAATVRYEGTWDFTSHAKSGRDRAQFDGIARNIGDYYGATSQNESINEDPNKGPVGHRSEFTVNFADKTLNGKLIRHHAGSDNAPTATERYRIDAKVSGNRFRGSATASNAADPYFGASSQSLEGGFFGPNGEELAGKFLADDQSLFAVFGAKQAQPAAAEAAFDAERISLDTLERQKSDTFGNARTLVIDGRAFPLLPESTGSDVATFVRSHQQDIGGKTLKTETCCSNLDYFSFGTYSLDGQNGNYFLSGERTPIANVPTSGNAHYRGTWSAKIISKDGRVWATGADNKEAGSRALFDFDFSNKTFSGSLIGEERAAKFPTFTLSGDITGNGFNGRARTGSNGFTLDPSGSNSAIVHIDAELKGGFYGPNAAEIGGSIHSRENGQDQVGGVFGGKRQTTTP